MRLTIDNLDGLGAVNYSPFLDESMPLKIERTLNEPSRLSGAIFLNSPGTPARRGRVVASSANGTILFTGYIATEAVQEYVGAGLIGPLYRTIFHAISDEWLLDKQAVVTGGAALAQAGGAVLTTLTNRVDASLLTTASLVGGRPVGVFEPGAAANWSSNAATIASTTYAAYRAVNDALTMQPAGTVTHTLSDGDGTLQVAALQSSAVKELANDVTVSGAIEPAAYINEVFTGDGTTAIFQTTEAPFIPASANKTLLNDSFNTGAFNPQVWTLKDPGSHLGFGSNGMAFTGGNGFDGQTTLTAIDPVEMGGTLIIEAGSVQLSGASDGVLCGLYQGSISRANCFAGYNVRQNNGAIVVAPLLNGSEIGTPYSIVTGHRYTLRIRLHCPETERVLQTYYARVDGAVQSFGGGLVAAPMQAVFELVDLGVSSNTPATVLYDSAMAGPVPDTPASCAFAAVDSVQLFGSMGYCRVTQTGSLWITSTLASGLSQTRLTGIAGEGVDCQLSVTGKITFFAGRVPVAGESVTVRYRTRQRAVARLQDTASVAQEAAGNARATGVALATGVAPGTAAWRGKVLKPPARSTADCESAAAAILSFATSRAAAIAGTYTAVNPQQTAYGWTDIWPGDVLALTSNGQALSVLVRRVSIADSSASPEILTYRIGFANDWAEGLGLTLSESIAADALLPQTALTGPAVVLPNLMQMTVVNVSSSVIQIDAGSDPPAGGGFEVRRREGAFGPGIDQDLVLRSPVRSFQIPRAAQLEQYFVRMYDGSNPPVYSRLSSAVFTNVPVA